MLQEIRPVRLMWWANFAYWSTQGEVWSQAKMDTTSDVGECTAPTRPQAHPPAHPPISTPASTPTHICAVLCTQHRRCCFDCANSRSITPTVYPPANPHPSPPPHLIRITSYHAPHPPPTPNTRSILFVCTECYGDGSVPGEMAREPICTWQPLARLPQPVLYRRSRQAAVRPRQLRFCRRQLLAQPEQHVAVLR